jgi:DNA-binding NarL/FixJ family response regulator
MSHLATESVDLVLTDQQMPRMTGLELIGRLRARGYPTPVVLLTGLETRDMCTAATEYGASACLAKPVNLDDLVWAIECALACRNPIKTSLTLRGPPPQAHS